MKRLDLEIQTVSQRLDTESEDPTTVRAEIATLKADRKEVSREEPMLAAELDGLNPKIAEIEAKRLAAQTKRVELVAKEQDDQRRVEELLVAIGAKRKVLDRATADSETQRDKILFELAEQLYVDRPTSLSAQLAPIDSIDVEAGTSERRMMELREILSTVDRRKLARGVAALLLISAVIAGVAWLALELFG